MRNILRTGAVLALGMLGGLAAASDYIVARSTDASIVKGTALASVIGFIELTKAGTMIANATFRPFTVYACVALLYFLLCFPLSAWSRRLERRLALGR